MVLSKINKNIFEIDLSNNAIGMKGGRMICRYLRDQ